MRKNILAGILALTLLLSGCGGKGNGAASGSNGSSGSTSGAEPAGIPTAEEIQAGDQVDVDFSTGVITDRTTGKTYQAAPFPPFIEGIIKSGGLLNSLKERGAAK